MNHNNSIQSLNEESLVKVLMSNGYPMSGLRSAIPKEFENDMKGRVKFGGHQRFCTVTPVSVPFTQMDGVNSLDLPGGRGLGQGR